MKETREQKSSLDDSHRRVYIATGLLCGLSLFLLALDDLHRDPNEDVTSGLFGSGLSFLAAIVMTQRWIPARFIEWGLALFILLGSAVDFYFAFQIPETSPRIALTLILACTVWLGVSPMRLALVLSAGLYTAYAILSLTRTNPDTGTFIFVTFVIIIIGVMSNFNRQVSLERSQSLKYRTQSLIDPLTDLPNRRAVFQKIESLNQIEQQPNQLAIMIIDIDHFKNVNDNYGHQVGDEVLYHLAQRLKQLVGANGMAARWGGEEFLLILAAKDEQELLGFSNKIHGQAFVFGTHLPTVTLSAGGAVSHEASNFDALVRLADHRLYLAKESGRNTVKWHTKALAS